MCGLAGFVRAAGVTRAADGATLERMLRCVEHRGPDDEGTFIGDGIALGHRRLSVIDVAGGHQPLAGARATTQLAINGEIYNYRELSAELVRLGHRFRTKSDSEVAARAYDQWGLDFLDRLDGMFALALWDGAQERLVLARDRMGEKPLFHARTASGIAFASELSALLQHPDVESRVDPLALARYLVFEYVPAPQSMIAGVHKLEPATALVFERGETRTLRYWTPQAVRVPPYFEAVTELRARLDRAVTSRMVADVPLGIFLSGGLDSSTIAALAAQTTTIETFSIGFRERSFDESEHARAVADHIGSRHHEHILAGTEMPELVPELPQILDEPIGDASIVPTALLSRFARTRVTVALGGDGGDELFAGYPMHQAHRIAPWLRRTPRPAVAALSTMADWLPHSERNFGFGFKARTFLRGAPLAPPLNHVHWMASFAPDDAPELLAPDLRAHVRTQNLLEPAMHAWARVAHDSEVVRGARFDALTYLPDDILTKVDRASMAVALEVRAPFLAREVVEFAWSLPRDYLMRGVTGKRILRDAVRDLLPDRVLKRPKKGFGIPVAAWLRGPLRELLTDTLSRPAIDAAGWLDGAAVERLVQRHLDGSADHRKPLWTLLVLELWRRHHVIGA